MEMMNENLQFERIKEAKINIVEVNPGLKAENFEKLTEDVDAVIFVVYASGTSPRWLNSVIKKRVDTGTPIFLVSKNMGNNHGILRTTYQTQSLSLQAGATPLEKVNINNLIEIEQAINDEFKKGKHGVSLSEAIREMFSYTSEEEKPVPDWKNPKKITEQKELFRHTLKRTGLSEEDLEKELERWDNGGTFDSRPPLTS